MTAQDVDVLVIGAGLAGIGAAWHLQQERPGTSFAILEARDAIGGTWDLFRFPGVRSDSDMHTLSLPYRPWRGTEARANGASIRDYLRETAAAYGIDTRIRFGRKVIRAEWSSAEARWTLDVRAGGRQETWTCAFLYSCTGYYDYAAGYTPHLVGVDGLPRPGRPPAVLARRPRRPRAAGGGDRQRRDGGHPRPGARRRRRGRHHGAALAELGGGREPAGPHGGPPAPLAAGPAGRLGDAHPERRGQHRPLRDLPACASGGGRIPASAYASSRRRDDGRRALHTALPPLGAAPLRRPGQRLPPRCRRRARRARHRPDRPVRSRGTGARFGSGRRGGRRRDRHRAEPAGARRHRPGRGRPRGGSRRDVRLPGRDAERCAEPRRLPRVRQRLVDAAGRGDP